MQKNVVDIFGELVDNITQTLGYKVFYQHGHPIEIIESLKTLSTIATGDEAKYPLVCLIQDFPEKTKNPEHYAEITLNIVICTLTEKELKAPERYLKTFNQILIPIYNQLLKEIAKSFYFIECNEREIQREKYDRLYWGREPIFDQRPNVFNDYIDAIEIKNLILNLKIKKC